MYITKDIIWLGKRYKLHIPRIVAVSVVMSFMNAATMLLFALLINELLTGKDTRKMVVLSSLLLMMFVLIFFMRDAENRMIHIGSVKLKEQIRADIMQHLFAAGPLVYSEERTGSLANMVWMKVDWLEYYFDEYLPQSIGILVFQSFVSVVLMKQLGLVGFVYFVCMAMVLMTPVLFNKKAIELGQKEWEAVSAYSSDSLDRIHGMYTLKILNQTGDQRKLMEESTGNLFHQTMRNLRFTTFENNYMSFFILLSRCFVLIAASLHGDFLGQGKMLLIIFAIIAATDDAYKILAAWIKGAKGISGVTEIIDFMRECEEKKSGINSSESKRMQDLEAVTVRNLDFSYGNEKVLKNINLQIERGKNVAIVGASGSGKSTLAYLLCGLYEPETGVIEKQCDGVEGAFLNRLSEVAAIWQDSRLFQGSVLDNIKMGCRDCSEEDVIMAAKSANIHDRIMELEEGYQTMIGDGGQTLSGGEKQRILIARALLRNTPIVIFDEATAYLDRENEKQIMESVRTTMQDKAVLTIAHRMETVEKADYVYFLKDGAIHAKGTHLELMNRCEEYRRHFGIERA
ncbi:MAG: ABC transporter ATP-binding protein/permease [Lachnospiraceae bacterium]|nr:ABC transporter ATP-binding protein/permease [Lachnospiraceae bacterium]